MPPAFEEQLTNSFTELRQILTNAGFADVDARPTYGYYSVVIGRKA